MSDLSDYRIKEPKKETGSLASYIFGFASSIALTLVAYFLATNHVVTGYPLIVILLELAILQFVAQLYLFLHFGKGKSAYWKSITLILMLFFTIVVIAGSIWIMSNLNYNMSPEEVNTYMKQQAQEGF